MKIFFFLVFVLLVGCYADHEQDESTPSSENKYYESDFKNDIVVKTFDEALHYVFTTIEYKDDPLDYWQTPEQTYTLKTGDCEDFAILVMWIIWEKLKIDSRLILISKDGIGHAIISVNGEYYDPRNTGVMYRTMKAYPVDLSTWKILYTFSYDETMHQAYFHHCRERKFN